MKRLLYIGLIIISLLGCSSVGYREEVRNAETERWRHPFNTASKAAEDMDYCNEKCCKS